jgi:hypothetical protein
MGYDVFCRNGLAAFRWAAPRFSREFFDAQQKLRG